MMIIIIPCKRLNSSIWLILAKWIECLPMGWETGVQSQVKSYQRLKKWYLIPPCLTLSIIRYGSRVKWSNPGKGVAPSSTPWYSSYWKGSLWVALDYSHQLYLTDRWDLNKYYHSRSEWTWEQLQGRGATHFPKLQDTSLTIGLFSVISRLLIGWGVLAVLRSAVSIF